MCGCLSHICFGPALYELTLGHYKLYQVNLYFNYSYIGSYELSGKEMVIELYFILHCLLLVSIVLDLSLFYKQNIHYGCVASQKISEDRKIKCQSSSHTLAASPSYVVNNYEKIDMKMFLLDDNFRILLIISYVSGHT